MLQKTNKNDLAIEMAKTLLMEAAERFQSPSSSTHGPLRFGIDLGTATIVLTAIDATDAPVYWDFARCSAVRDGIVVNFADAATAVARLKARAENILSASINSAATAYPPGVSEPDARACRFVLEAAGIECRGLVDEVSAAQALLRLESGVIVDVGGGSTGVGIVENGRIVALDDQPGGGHHLDLILAGALAISIEEAEALKVTASPEHVQILRPGIERIAASVKRQAGAYPIDAIHLVGGTVRLPGTDAIVSRFIDRPALAYPHSELATPFGIAMS